MAGSERTATWETEWNWVRVGQTRACGARTAVRAALRWRRGVAQGNSAHRTRSGSHSLIQQPLSINSMSGIVMWSFPQRAFRVCGGQIHRQINQGPMVQIKIAMR